MNSRRENYLKVICRSWKGKTSGHGPFSGGEQDQLSRKYIELPDLLVLWPLKGIRIYLNKFYRTECQHFSTGLDKSHAPSRYGN